MKSMRSSFALLFTTLGAALLFANCTVKSVEDDGSDTTCSSGATRHCACTNGDEGAQQCNSKGSGFGECKCDGSITVGGSSSNTTNNNEAGDGTNTSTGGKGGTSSTTAGTSAGGTSAGGAEPLAEAGAGGAGTDPVGNIDPTDCAACLAELCPMQWKACSDDTQCLSTDLDGTGEYEKIQNGCIEPERLNGVVKRDVVRGCGVSVGQSTDPSFNQDWAPVQMAPSTVNLMNCMAMGATKPDASWANDPDNFPIDKDNVVQPVPWPAGTCAKLACTSQIQ